MPKDSSSMVQLCTLTTLQDERQMFTFLFPSLPAVVSILGSWGCGQGSSSAIAHPSAQALTTSVGSAIKLTASKTSFTLCSKYISKNTKSSLGSLSTTAHLSDRFSQWQEKLKKSYYHYFEMHFIAFSKAILNRWNLFGNSVEQPLTLKSSVHLSTDICTHSQFWSMCSSAVLDQTLLFLI